MTDLPRAPESVGATPALSFLFAPGAGAPASSPWMRAFRDRLAALGHRVETFDYDYQRVGRRSPDRLPALIDAHRAAFDELRATHEGPIVAIGKSMGGRIGCHLSLALGAQGPSALVCLGYPLIGQNGAVRDAVLLELRTPILFVQGTRDPMCPLPQLAEIRARMTAPSELHVVEGGDHSLVVSRTRLKAEATTQPAIDAQVVAAVEAFARRSSPVAATVPRP